MGACGGREFKKDLCDRDLTSRVLERWKRSGDGDVDRKED